MSFKEYLHVENLNNVEVDGILEGTCHIFPKLDGTNGSAWMDDGIIKAGSRKRELTLTNDNAGFCNWVNHSGALCSFFHKHKDRYRLFGEWLVPNHLRTYVDEAWRNFYVFDVYDRYEHRYLGYDSYEPMLSIFEINTIPCYVTIDCPTQAHLDAALNANCYLVKHDHGLGEGIVIKNYKFTNQYERYTYAKIVREEYKQPQGKTKQNNKLDKDKMEQLIVDKYITNVVCNKAYAKLIFGINGWTGKFIPRLLDTIFHDLITEETWDMLKRFKNPTVNFKILKHSCNRKVKELKPELF